MSRIITSPAKRFMGSVALPDYLTWPQYLDWQAAKEKAAEFLRKEITGEGENQRVEFFYRYQDTHPLYVPVICRIVTRWQLENFPADPSLENFPATQTSAKLVEWLIKEIEALWLDEADIPNGSTPQLIAMPAAMEASLTNS